MHCSKCGAINSEGSQYCISCGNLIGNVDINENQNNQSNSILDQNIINSNVGQQQPNVVNDDPNSYMTNQPMMNQSMEKNADLSQNVIETNQSNVEKSSFTSGNFIKGLFTKPLTTIEENKEYLESNEKMKFAAIVTIALTVLSILGLIISTIFYNNGSDGIKFSTELLKYIDWIELIVNTILLNALFVFGVPLVYVIAGKILKENIKYSDIIGYIASAFIPYSIINNFLSPIVTSIHAESGIIISNIGTMVTMIFIYEFVNFKAKIDGNKKLIFNILGYIIAIISYFIIIYVYNELDLF